MRILHVTKHGARHSIMELEVETRLTLRSNQSYVAANNKDVIATDSQKNTVYILAKLHGIRNAEDFGILLAKHFLSQYFWWLELK